MSFIEKIETVLTQPLLHRGYSIVRVQMNGQKRKQLQIMIDRIDGQAITVDDCSTASRPISVILDSENLIEDSYILEVSSPGIDRPLVKPADFKRFQGEKISLQSNILVNGRKKFIGLLETAGDNAITVILDQPLNDAEESNKLSFDYVDIRSAKLYVEI